MWKPVPALAAASVLAAGCNSGVAPPGDTGVCYHVVQDKAGAPKFNVLVRDIPNLETCAARLEGLRQRFLRLGGSHMNIMGAYQTNYLWLDRAGVTSSRTLTGIRYVALVRTGDNRLAIPGAMPQP